MTGITERIHDFAAGRLVYRTDACGRTELLLLPAGTELDPSSLPEHRSSLLPDPALDHLPWRETVEPVSLDSLIQISLSGTPSPGGFSQGRTMRMGEATRTLVTESQTTPEPGHIVTTLRHPSGLLIDHHLIGDAAAPYLRLWCECRNKTDLPVTLDMLSSFSLGGITPFDASVTPERLILHRFRSSWSAEGRHEAVSLEELNLERSWIGHSANCERFGQIGSMPVRGFFPRVAIEDRVAGVTWGAALSWAGSWQIEVYRKDDHVALSGGLADREFGHWRKTLEPGDRFTTPEATLACVVGGIDEVCDALNEAQVPAARVHPTSEAHLPVICNEWCTSWGNPGHENLLAIAERIAPLGIGYLVIDAGWYKRDGSDWENGQGDWQVNRDLFPDGLAATASMIRELGIIPGLWFEMEVVGSASDAWLETDLLLSRDGVPLSVDGRRFWDLRNPKAVELLAERVTGTLEEAGIGYLKVDYNETIGIGVDGAESLGEGLRQQIEGVYRFFTLIRSRLPELVIENCSSGGHRLEPSMMALTDMGSFSDAHESLEIPIIAANLHRLILPSQSQVWAVLHADDAPRRTRYLLAAGLLGRLCISGEIRDLDANQMELVAAAVSFAALAEEVIRVGRTRVYREIGKSYRNPTGWQIVVRSCGSKCLVVANLFGGSAPASFSAPLPGAGYRVAESLSGPELIGRVVGDRFVCDGTEAFSGAAFMLECAGSSPHR